MIRIHKDHQDIKYKNGLWTWNETKNIPEYHPYISFEKLNERFIYSMDFKFKRSLTPSEEYAFREHFMRKDTSPIPETIEIIDILNLVLFLVPKNFLSDKFVKFLHMQPVYEFLHALIIYFKYFLDMVEFVLIRRDEVMRCGQTQSEQSHEIKRIFSRNLSYYRIILARNYANVIPAVGPMKEFHHLKLIEKISNTKQDRIFYEKFMAVCLQIVWIALHRRAYDVIEMEMIRLFRSEHFLSHVPEQLKFSPVERSFLYGRFYKIVNFNVTLSPLMSEIKNLTKEDRPLLWIGHSKYRGTDESIAKVELEFLTRPSELNHIDVDHGILGHPKSLYNTMLELDLPAKNRARYSELNDPCHLIRQPVLPVPKLNTLKKRTQAKTYEHFFNFPTTINLPLTDTMKEQWTLRDDVIDYCRQNDLIDDIFKRVKRELETESAESSKLQINPEEFLAQVKNRSAAKRTK